MSEQRNIADLMAELAELERRRAEINRAIETHFAPRASCPTVAFHWQDGVVQCLLRPQTIASSSTATMTDPRPDTRTEAERRADAYCPLDMFGDPDR